MLLIRPLIKSYGNYEVLNMGEMHLSKAAYRIKGANGSGKSTFLKAIAGLTQFKGDVLNDKISLKRWLPFTGISRVNTFFLFKLFR